MKLLSALLLALGVLAAGALPASADPVIYGDDALSAKPGELTAYPLTVLVDDAGVATLVYVQETGPLANGVFARRRAPGGAYGPPIPIGGERAYSADAGIAGDGTITVVWEEDGASAGVVARTIRPDGSLGSVQTLGTGLGLDQARVAVAPSGAALAVWQKNGTPDRVVATSRAAGADSFAPGEATVSSTAAGETGYQPVPLIGADGAAYATYAQDSGSVRLIYVRAFDIAANASSGTAKQVSTPAAGRSADDAAGAIDPVTKDLVLAWSEDVAVPGGSQDVIKARRARADLAVFGAAGRISRADDVPNRDADEPRAHAAPDGAVAVGWREDSATDNEAAAPVAVRPSGGPFEEPFNVTAADSTASSGPAEPRWDAFGRLFVGFRQRRPGDGITRAAVRTRRADGTWAPTTVLSPNRTDGNYAAGALAVPDRNGNLLITYGQVLPPDDDFAVVAAYGDDDGAPEVDPIAPDPAAALVSAPLQLSTVVRDFSTTTTTWSFGDGSPEEPGLSVAHGFAKPGGYDVKVTATDAAGQAASRSARATISEARPPRVNRRPDSNITLRRTRMRRGAFKRIRGTASDDTRVARVQVAVVRLRGTKRRPKCAVMRRNGSLKRVKAAGRTCRPRFWQTAKGTTTWSLKLAKRLGRGRYVVFSRAIDDQGARERSFSAKDRNRRTLRLRR